MEALEHPDITSARRTGYPTSFKIHHDPRICPNCLSEPIDEESWDVDGVEVCRSCMLEMVREYIAMEPEAAAQLIGAERRAAS